MDRYDGGQRRPVNKRPFSGCGCLMIGALFTIAVMISITIGYMSFSSLLRDEDNAESPEQTFYWQREPIDEDLSEETAWYQDNNTGEDRWINDAEWLESGLQYFFEQTGVRPYLYINTPEDSAEIREMTDEELFGYVIELYDELFSDGAHALFVISDDGDGDRRYSEYIGPQALLVMDNEAVQFLCECFDFYWAAGLDNETAFSNSFRETADKLMGEVMETAPEPIVQTSEEFIELGELISKFEAWIAGLPGKLSLDNMSDSTKNYIALALVILIGSVAIAAVLAWRRRQEARERDE